MTLLAAGFLLGLAGSLHCVMMCGPLVLLATAGPADATARASTRARYVVRAVWHHAGRILMYGALGVGAGTAGHLLGDTGLRQWVSIVAGLGLAVGAALSLTGRHGLPGRGRWAHAITRIVARATRALRRDRASNRIALGLLNGLLPCGLLYGALVAATGLGHPLSSGGFMLAFGLGSVPALAATTTALSGTRRSQTVFRRLSPVVSGAVGLLLIARGLTGPAPHAHGRATEPHVHPASIGVMAR
ncbi:MAG: sulfite exporter TauE/SafE family protein [Acidobacteriota bacterium]